MSFDPGPTGRDPEDPFGDGGTRPFNTPAGDSPEPTGSWTPEADGPAPEYGDSHYRDPQYRDPQYGDPQYGDPPPPRRRGLTALLAVVVVGLAALIGVLIWLMLRSDNADPTDQQRTGPAVTAPTTVAPTTTAPTTSQPQPGTTNPETTTPATTPSATTPSATTPSAPTEPPPAEIPLPPVDGAVWFAQFGAFDTEENAQATRDRHFGAVILPGHRLGSSSAYVVARPTESEADAARVCARFTEGECVVKRSV